MKPGAYLGRITAPWGAEYMAWKVPGGKYLVAVEYYRMMTLGRMTP